jgi:hypothetical protein
MLNLRELLRWPARRCSMQRLMPCLMRTAALLLASAPGTWADEFFSIRDENPLLRGFYLPLASDSRRDAGGIFAATFSISNTLNVENTAAERLLVDGESDTLRLSYEHSMTADWRYRFTLPVIRDSGGFLDDTIDSWHRWFGFSRGNRPYYPQRQLLYSYSGRGNVDLQRSHTGVGDLSADAGWYAVDDAQRTISFWGGLKAPTGSVGALTSDGAWDAALWGHVARRWTRWQLAAELGLTQPFGDEIFSGAAHRSSAFARAAVTRDLGRTWALRAQLDGQTSRVAGTDLRFLGPSLQATLGLVHRWANHWRIEMGFAEDAAVNTAPDITFFLGIHD